MRRAGRIGAWVVLLSLFATQAWTDNETVDVRSPWSFVEGCHVLIDHEPNALGTRFSLLVHMDAQSALRADDHGGTARPAFNYLFAFEQSLWRDASIIGYVEGGRGDGLDPILGDVLGTGSVAGEPDDVYVSRLFLQQDLWGRRAQFLLGKVDLSDFFDTNAVINCENVQFLSPSLVNNPTIPFPEFGLGAATKIVPTRWFYLQGALADAGAGGTGTGFDTAFHDGERTFGIVETGFTPTLGGREGNYRLIGWHDPTSDAGRDGFALSFDQELTERLSVGARYGHSHAADGDIEHFWSAGVQLAGPVAARADDLFGFAVAQGIPSKTDHAPGEHRRSETLFETYYAFQVNRHLAVTPDLQVILNPGASTLHTTDVIAGIRIVIAF